MGLTGIAFKQAILHFVFAFVLTFAFGVYGVFVVVGFVMGVELMQMCYRSFRDGYKWDDVLRKPLLLLKYTHPKDTLFDLLTYALGIAVGLLCR